MAEILFFENELTESTILIKMKGTLNSQTIVDFQEKFYNLQKQGYTYFILDMEEIDSVNSSGLGSLIYLVDTLEPPQTIVLTKLSSKVKVVFEMLNLDTYFKLFPNEDEALSYLEGGQEETPEDSEEFSKTSRRQAFTKSNFNKSLRSKTFGKDTLRRKLGRQSKSSMSRFTKSASSQQQSSMLSKDDILSQTEITRDDVDELANIFDILITRINFDGEERDQIKEVLMDISNMALERVEKKQKVSYNMIINPNYIDFNFRITRK